MTVISAGNLVSEFGTDPVARGPAPSWLIAINSQGKKLLNTLKNFQSAHLLLASFAILSSYTVGTVCVRQVSRSWILRKNDG